MATITKDEFLELDFREFPETFSSPNGSFQVHQLSQHVWVCIEMKPSRYAKDWTLVPDYPNRFLTYIGYEMHETDIPLWITIIQKKFIYTAVQMRSGKKDRTGKPKEAKFFGLSHRSTMLLAFEDRLPF